MRAIILIMIGVCGLAKASSQDPHYFSENIQKVGSRVYFNSAAWIANVLVPAGKILKVANVRTSTQQTEKGIIDIDYIDLVSIGTDNSVSLTCTRPRQKTLRISVMATC